jgi:hypothetical protein
MGLIWVVVIVVRKRMIGRVVLGRLMGERIGRWFGVEFDGSDGAEDEFELIVDVEVLGEEFVDGEFGVVDHGLVGFLEFC